MCTNQTTPRCVEKGKVFRCDPPDSKPTIPVMDMLVIRIEWLVEINLYTILMRWLPRSVRVRVRGRLLMSFLFCFVQVAGRVRTERHGVYRSQ